MGVVALGLLLVHPLILIFPVIQGIAGSTPSPVVGICHNDSLIISLCVDPARCNLNLAKETAYPVRSLASHAWIVGSIYSHFSLGPHLHIG